MTHDSNRLWWFIDPDTGRPAYAQHVYGPLNRPFYFLSRDCTGPAYIEGPLPPPRVPFSYGNTSGLRVRTDTAVYQQIIYKSRKDEAANFCTPTPDEGGIAALRMAEADVPIWPGLVFPNLSLTPPLHLERLP